MSSENVLTILTTAAYKDGTQLYNEEVMMAGVSEVKLLPGSKLAVTGYRFLNITLALPRAEYETFVEGLKSGSAELIIEGMKTEVERAR